MYHSLKLVKVDFSIKLYMMTGSYVNIKRNTVRIHEIWTQFTKSKPFCYTVFFSMLKYRKITQEYVWTLITLLDRSLYFLNWCLEKITSCSWKNTKGEPQNRLVLFHYFKLGIFKDSNENCKSSISF